MLEHSHYLPRYQDIATIAIAAMLSKIIMQVNVLLSGTLSCGPHNVLPASPSELYRGPSGLYLWMVLLMPSTTTLVADDTWDTYFCDPGRSGILEDLGSWTTWNPGRPVDMLQETGGILEAPILKLTKTAESPHFSCPIL